MFNISHSNAAATSAANLLYAVVADSDHPELAKVCYRTLR